jgi:hypothetical protein
MTESEKNRDIDVCDGDTEASKESFTPEELLVLEKTIIRIPLADQAGFMLRVRKAKKVGVSIEDLKIRETSREALTEEELEKRAAKAVIERTLKEEKPVDEISVRVGDNRSKLNYAIQQMIVDAGFFVKGQRGTSDKTVHTSRLTREDIDEILDGDEKLEK